MQTHQKIYAAFSWLVKNLLIFLVGAALGVLAVFMRAESLLQSAIPKEVGLGVIALAPLLILFYAMFFGTIGGTLAIILYYTIKIVRNRRAARLSASADGQADARLKKIREEQHEN